jgi:hypothetical protein
MWFEEANPPPSLYGEDCNSRLKKVKAEVNAHKPRGLDFFYPAGLQLRKGRRGVAGRKSGSRNRKYGILKMVVVKF